MNPYDLNTRYLHHIRAAQAAAGRTFAYHVIMARGLYRLLCDIEMDGGPPAPMGMPHILTLTDEEARRLC